MEFIPFVILAAALALVLSCVLGRKYFLGIFLLILVGFPILVLSAVLSCTDTGHSH